MSDRGFLVAPLNTLWLRGATPMDAGGVTGAASADLMFPPTAWTWQGMIRTRVLEALLGERLRTASSSEIAAMVGGPDALPPGWRIRGPFPAVRSMDRRGRSSVMPWVPWPRCVGVSWSGPYCGATSTRYLAPRRVERDGLVATSAQEVGGETGHRALLRPGYAMPDEGWMSLATLMGAIDEGSREAPGARWRWDEVCWSTKRSDAALPPFVHVETRTGLEIGADGIAEDHMLYTAPHLRFDDEAGLWGLLEGAPPDIAGTLQGGVAHLGRKARVATLHTADVPDDLMDFLTGARLRRVAEESLQALEYVRVVLLTPALVPTEGHGASAVPFEVPEGAKLIAHQASPGPFVGGTNWAARSSRPLQSTFAAGSVWVFHLANPETRLDDAKRLAGADTSRLTVAERFGFAQRVVTPLAADMILKNSEEEETKA